MLKTKLKKSLDQSIFTGCCTIYMKQVEKESIAWSHLVHAHKIDYEKLGTLVDMSHRKFLMIVEI